MSVKEFCHNAKMRIEKCNDFDSKRKFLIDHVRKVIYTKNKVAIIGAVPLGSNDGDPKIEFKIESNFNKKEFFKKRVRYLVDGRLKEWGSGGRDTIRTARTKELQLPEVKAAQITQQTMDTPLRTATVRYLAKSYLRNQKEWDAARENLIASAIKQGSKKL